MSVSHWRRTGTAAAANGVHAANGSNEPLRDCVLHTTPHHVAVDDFYAPHYAATTSFGPMWM
jgi:hypothetical protein